MTDNIIIEDELSRTREFRQTRQKRIEVLKSLGAPKELIEIEERISKMTFSEWQALCEEDAKAEELKKKEYRKNNPPSASVANLIWEKFDLWFDKYKDDREILELELDTGHYFYEPWYWDERAPGAEEEFYKHILSEDDWWSENYLPVFEVCNQKIRNRLNSLDAEGK
jgi:hypothetical protein